MSIVEQPREDVLSMRELDQNLVLAAEKGDLAEVKRLIKTGADVRGRYFPSPGTRWGSPGIEVVEVHRYTHRAKVRHLNQNPYTGGVEEKEYLARDFGWTGLQAAAAGAHLEVVRFLIESGACINARPGSPGGRTALQWAAGTKNLELVQLLLGHDAYVNAPPVTDDGRTALQQAAECGCEKTVELLLRSGAQINASAAKRSGRTALQAASGQGNHHLVKYLLDHGAAGVKPSECYGASALSAAAAGGHLDTVRLLLESGAQINERGEYYSRTALQAAAEHGQMHIVEFLIENSADVNASASIAGGRTALQAAAEQGHHDVVNLLIQRNARVDEPPVDYHGRSALQAAAERGDYQMVDILLASLGPEAVDEAGKRDGRTALQAASEHGHVEIIKALIARGTSVNESPGQHGGRTALQAAAGRGDMDVTRFLLDFGADVNARGLDYGGRTALGAAAAEGNLEIVQLLVLRGAGVGGEGAEGGGEALCLAAIGGHAHVVQFLLEKGAGVNSRILWGRWERFSPLHGAAYGGSVDIANLLLGAGAVVSQPTQDSHNPFYLAVQRGHINIATRLTQYGADINEAALWPRYVYEPATALYYAAENGDRDMVEWLLENMADVHEVVAGPGANRVSTAAVGGGDENVIKILLSKGGNKELLFHIASQKGDLQLVKLLHGMEVNINSGGVTAYGRARTPLGEAARFGFEDVVGFLLEKGADVNATGMKHGMTSLQEAAENGHHEVVKMLLARNADINAGAAVGAAALQLAAQGGHLETVKVLLSNGLDINSPVSRRSERTALHFALEKKHYELGFFLLNSGAHARDLPIVNGKHPLHRLCKDKHIELFATLLERCVGEDVNLKDLSGSTILHIALRGGHTMVFDCLLMNQRIDFEIRDARGNTALQYAIQEDNIEAARRLLNKGAKTNGLTFKQLQKVAESTRADHRSGSNEEGNDDKPYVLVSLHQQTGMYLRRKSRVRFTFEDWEFRQMMSVFFINPEVELENIDKSFVSPSVFLPDNGYPNPTSAGSVVHWGWLTFMRDRWGDVGVLGEFRGGIPMNQDMNANVIFVPFIRFDWHAIRAKGPDLQLVSNTEGIGGSEGKGTMDKDDVNDVPAFSIKARRVEISWIMSNASFSTNEMSKTLRSVHFRGSLTSEGKYIPESGLEFVLWLLGDVCDHWIELLHKAKKHLVEIRDFQLAAGGRDPDVIKSLLGHSREWYRLRESLGEHVAQACKILKEFKEREALFGEIIPATRKPQKEDKGETKTIRVDGSAVSPPTTNPRGDNPAKVGNITTLDPLEPKPGMITRRDTHTAAENVKEQQTTTSPPSKMPKQGKSRQAADIAALPQIIDLEKRVSKLKDFGELLSDLDKETKEMIELEFNLVSIHEARQSIQEARRSVKMSESMKRLSWITFIFLPLMFVTGLFGMNVDILENNPSWKWYPISAAPFMIFVMFAWFLSKCSPLTKPKRWYDARDSRSLLHNPMGLLTRRMKKKQDVEMGNEMKEHSD